MSEELENNVAETEEIAEQEQEIPEIDSKYRMIILAAQRSKQLQRGAVPRVEADMKKQKTTRVAMREIADKKIHFKIEELEIPPTRPRN